MGYKLGIDVGGTFTDLVLVTGEDEIRVAKTPTTPENQAEGLLAAIEKAASLVGRGPEAFLAETDLVPVQA